MSHIRNLLGTSTRQRNLKSAPRRDCICQTTAGHLLPIKAGSWRTWAPESTRRSSGEGHFAIGTDRALNHIWADQARGRME